MENPEIDYGYKGVKLSRMGDTVTLTLDYYQSKEDMTKQKKAVEAKVEKIIKEEIKSNMTDVQKEIAIHDYIAKNAEYNLEGLKRYIPTDHNAYGVLVLGKGVCESYAKAFYIVGKAAELEVRYVTGVSKNPSGGQENHAWNMIKLDDGWYNVDVTWDDPVVENEADKWLEVRYDYFNVPDSIMNKTHQRNKVINEYGNVVDKDVTVNYPSANGKKYTYENLDIIEEDKDGNKFINVKNRDELDEKIKNAINNKETSLFLKLYNLGMTQQDLLDEVKTVIDNNSDMSWLTRYNVKSSGKDIMLVEYTFKY